MQKRASSMHGQSRMFQRSGVYYFRAKIPVDLLEHYHPKKDIKISLQTKDKVKAKKACNLYSVKVDQEFEQIRQQIAKRTSPLETVVQLSDEEIQQITNRWINGSLKADEELRSMGLLDEAVLKLMNDSHKAREQEFKKASALGSSEWGDYWLEAAMPMSGYSPSNLDANSRKRLAVAMVQAQRTVLKYQIERNEGEIVKTDEIAPVSKSARTGQSATSGKGISLDKVSISVQ